MARILNCTAASLRAVLCYVDSGVTTTIAYDDDSLAEPLARKLEDTLGKKGGSQSVTLVFGAREEALERQFECVCSSIGAIMRTLAAEY